jgi:hypothetical protein
LVVDPAPHRVHHLGDGRGEERIVASDYRVVPGQVLRDQRAGRIGLHHQVTRSWPSAWVAADVGVHALRLAEDPMPRHGLPACQAPVGPPAPGRAVAAPFWPPGTPGVAATSCPSSLRKRGPKAPLPIGFAMSTIR